MEPKTWWNLDREGNSATSLISQRQQRGVLVIILDVSAKIYDLGWGSGVAPTLTPLLARKIHIIRVGQNRIYTPYMTVYMVISLPKIPYMSPSGSYHWSVGLARTIYIRCIYGIFGRETTIYTVVYGAHIRFWPTPLIRWGLRLFVFCVLNNSWEFLIFFGILSGESGFSN